MAKKDSTDFNNIKNWLDPQLAKRGLSVEEFSRKADVSRASVYFWRSDTTRPDVEQMARVCKVLGVPLEEGLRQYTPKQNGRPKGTANMRQVHAEG